MGTMKKLLNIQIVLIAIAYLVMAGVLFYSMIGEHL